MYNLDVDALEKSGIQVNDAYLERMLGELADLEHIIQSLADSLKAEG
jgi:hypothetical protein